jgi:eukaryotic-like serine/threonine-protein kinase
MPLSTGDKFGPYEIVAPIGAGGMGEVYKARDTRLDRIVAIKTSKMELPERFAREARAVAALNNKYLPALRPGDSAGWRWLSGDGIHRRIADCSCRFGA